MKKITWYELRTSKVYSKPVRDMANNAILDIMKYKRRITEQDKQLEHLRNTVYKLNLQITERDYR